MNTNHIKTQLAMEVYNIGELSLMQRFSAALAKGVSRYPIHRVLRFAVRGELEPFFDKLALREDWCALRVDDTHLVLDTGKLLISAQGNRKSDYCSCHFEIWSADVETAEAAKAVILETAGSARLTEPMFSIDWYFLTSRGSLECATIEELANDVLLDEAYPGVDGGVNAFIDRYLASDETVLVLQGPPGTGKTRLVRAILGRISRRTGEEAQVMYTGDKKTLESDQIFVKFITGWEDAFVVEDADHILRPRSDGNEHLHRFLTIADGVVRSQGRKIIFTTNLPNVGDLDEALVRPGRCFARVNIREMTHAEAIVFIDARLPD